MAKTPNTTVSGEWHDVARDALWCVPCSYLWGVSGWLQKFAYDMRMRLSPLLVVLSFACGSPTTAKRSKPETTKVAEADAVAVGTLVATLQAGHFEQALDEANTILTTSPKNAKAASVRAIARYQQAGSKLRDEVFAVLDGFQESFDHPRMRGALTDFELALANVQDDLRVASADANLALDLCLACWEHDWNHSGEIDPNDRLLFQVEVDVNGERLPENDARRRPTFRFDVGDTHWALAMMSFQRAFMNVILAYEWKELDALVGSFFGPTPERTMIRLGDAKRITLARDLASLSGALKNVGADGLVQPRPRLPGGSTPPVIVIRPGGK